MRWPWSRPEVRMARPYTDALVDYLTTSAGGTSAGDPSAIAALEAAAGLYARAVSPVPWSITRRSDRGCGR